MDAIDMVTKLITDKYKNLQTQRGKKNEAELLGLQIF